MKRVTLKVTGGRGDKIARFHDCGREGDVETFKHSLDRSGCIFVRVESESGDVVFEDDECGKTSQRGFVRSDPRRWQFDKSIGWSLTARIRK